MRKNKWSDIKIMEWSIETFPGLRCEKQIKKLEEELCEAEAEYGKNRERWLEEMADVSIVATILEYRFKSKIGAIMGRYIECLPEKNQIFEARDKKMDVNIMRKWSNINGVYRHV